MANWYFDLPKGPVHARYSKSILHGIFFKAKSIHHGNVSNVEHTLYIYIQNTFYFVCEIIKFVVAI
jgi:hypothetical protein